jgi:hypothetical protein
MKSVKRRKVSPTKDQGQVKAIASMTTDSPDFEVKSCLRTIDQTRHGSLLNIPDKEWKLHLQHVQQEETKSDSKVSAARNHSHRIHVLRGLLSPIECASIVKSAKSAFGFCKLDGQYSSLERDARRLCILDHDLASLLWERIQVSAVSEHKKQWDAMVPFGFGVAGEWQPVRVNPCMRLSHYQAPSVGFTPHYDSQFCQSATVRSVLSVVIYLEQSADIKGGQTLFYQPSPTSKAPVPPSGLTTTQEIALAGGLDKLEARSIQGDVGCCLLFPHQVLHAGAPLEHGSKIILRTDLIFERRLSPLHDGPTLAIGRQLFEEPGFRECLELFREAQNAELDGQVDRASRLYERALSMRRAASVLGDDTKRLVDATSRLLDKADACMVMLAYMSLQDMNAFRCCSRLCRALVQRYHGVMWTRYKLDIKREPRQVASDMVTTAVIDFPPRFARFRKEQRDDDKQKRPIYIPYVGTSVRQGTSSYFVYSSSAQVKHFRKHPDACLRVIAMYAMFLFGTDQDSETFVAEYDPQRQTIVRCSKEWLLTCAYYQLPCKGSYFHLPCNGKFKVDVTSDEVNHLDLPTSDDSEEEQEELEEPEEEEDEDEDMDMDMEVQVQVDKNKDKIGQRRLASIKTMVEETDEDDVDMSASLKEEKKAKPVKNIVVSDDEDELATCASNAEEYSKRGSSRRTPHASSTTTSIASKQGNPEARKSKSKPLKYDEDGEHDDSGKGKVRWPPRKESSLANASKSAISGARATSRSVQVESKVAKGKKGKKKVVATVVAPHKLQKIRKEAEADKRAFAASVDSLFLTTTFASSTITAPLTINLTTYLGENRNKRTYTDLHQRRWNEQGTMQAAVRSPSKTLVNVIDRSHAVNTCDCGMGDSDVSKRVKSVADLHFNNLISDFARQKLSVKAYTNDPSSAKKLCGCALGSKFTQIAGRATEPHWIASMAALDLPSFNHASCQCSGRRMTTFRSKTVQFNHQSVMDHVHIRIVSQSASRIVFQTDYQAIHAL